MSAGYNKDIFCVRGHDPSAELPSVVIARTKTLLQRPDGLDMDTIRAQLAVLDTVYSDDRASESEIDEARKLMEVLSSKMSTYRDSIRAAGSRVSRSSFVRAPASAPGPEPAPAEDDGPHTINHDASHENAAAKIDVLGEVKPDEIEIAYDNCLGRGGFGVVYSGKCRGVPVAIKQLHEELRSNDREVKKFYNEIKINSGIRHPYCCEYIGYMKEPLSIVTRLYPTALDEVIFEGRLTTQDRFRIAYQIVSAVYYMHSIGLLHRDLKPENVFLDDNGDARVGDFGEVEMVPTGLLKDEGDPPGSYWYMSPELLSHKQFDGRCEVYAIGLLLCSLFTGTNPFFDSESEEDMARIQKMCAGKEHLLFKFSEKHWSTRIDDGKPQKELFDLILECCAFDITKRPDIGDVLSRIVSVGVNSVISRSRSTATYWRIVSNGAYRNNVFSFEFARNMPLIQLIIKDDEKHKDPKAAARAPPASEYEKQFQAKQLKKAKARYIVETLMLATPPSWKLMDIEHFWFISCWFPCFFNNLNAFRWMERTVKSQWFAREENEAINRLRGQKGKCFVICPSLVDPYHYPFTLYTTEGKHPIHRKLENGATVFICHDVTGEHSYPALEIFAGNLTASGFVVAPPLH